MHMARGQRRAVQDMAWLMSTTTRMVGCRSVAALLALADETIHAGFGYDQVTVLLVDVASGTLRAHSASDAQGHTLSPSDRGMSSGEDGCWTHLLADPRLHAGGPGFLYQEQIPRVASPEVQGSHAGLPGQTLHVALRSADTMLGMISVATLAGGRPITPAEAPPLVAFANALATALEKVAVLETWERRGSALDADLEQRVKQVTWLQESACLLGSRTGLDEVLDTVYDCIRHGLNYDRVGIFLLERDANGRLIDTEVRGADDAGNPRGPQPPPPAVEETTVATDSPDLSHLQQGHAYYYCPDRWAITLPHMRWTLDGHMREQLAVALRHDGVLIGYLSVDNLISERPIAESDAAPLVTFSAQAALAINRARLWTAHEAQGRNLAQRVAQLEWLRQISHRVASAATVDQVLNVVYDGVRHGLGYDHVDLFLCAPDRRGVDQLRGTDAQGHMLSLPDRTLPLGRARPRWQVRDLAALLHGAPFLSTADSAALPLAEEQVWHDGTPRQTLTVPIHSGQMLMGAIAVAMRPRGRSFATEDADLLRALADHASTALDNARLHERERAEHARLAVIAQTDALTGLPNRTVLHERLEQALDVAQRDVSTVALLLIDLDGFKEVNDTHGHHAGDAVLQQVSARLCGALHPSATVARLGGDEFAVALPATDAAGAAHVARTLLDALDGPIIVDNQPLMIRASLGIALSPDHGRDTRALLRAADVAMYVAKRSHSGHALYAPEQEEHRLPAADARRRGQRGEHPHVGGPERQASR